jgi:hypothetical protein
MTAHMPRKRGLTEAEARRIVNADLWESKPMPGLGERGGEVMACNKIQHWDEPEPCELCAKESGDELAKIYRSLADWQRWHAEAIELLKQAADEFEDRYEHDAAPIPGRREQVWYGAVRALLKTRGEAR